MMTTVFKSKIKWCLIVSLMIFAALSILGGVRNALKPTGSIDNQWHPAKIMMSGVDPYQLCLDAHEKGETVYQLCQMPNYPPSSLAFLAPLTLLDWPHARLVWAVLNLLFTAIVLYSVYRLLEGKISNYWFIALGCLFVMSTSWRVTVGNGQCGLFSMAFFCLTLTELKWPRLLTGLSLAVSWFKYTITFPLTIWHMRSKRGMVAIVIAVLIHVVLLICMSIHTGSSPIKLLLGSVAVSKIFTSIGNGNVFGAAKLMGCDNRLWPALVGLLILSLATFFSRKEKDILSWLGVFAFVLLNVLFHIDYDAVVLVFPLAWVIRDRLASFRSVYYLAAILWYWFAIKLAFVLRGYVGLDADLLNTVVFWFSFCLVLGIIVLDCINLACSRCFETTSRLVGALKSKIGIV